MGRMQWLVFSGACCLSLFCMESVNMIFVGGQMDHWCRVDDLDTRPYEQQKSAAIPLHTDLGVADSEGTVVSSGRQYSRCSMYAVNWSTIDEATRWNRSGHLFPVDNDTRSGDVVACSSWIYDQSQYKSTIVSRASMHQSNCMFIDHPRRGVLYNVGRLSLSLSLSLCLSVCMYMSDDNLRISKALT